MSRKKTSRKKTSRKKTSRKKIAIVGLSGILGVAGLMTGCANKTTNDTSIKSSESYTIGETVYFGFGDGTEADKPKMEPMAIISETQDPNSLQLVMQVEESKDSDESKASGESKSSLEKSGKAEGLVEPKEVNSVETFDSALKKCNDFLRQQKYYSLTDNEDTKIKVSNLSTDSAPTISIRDSNSSIKSYRNLEDNQMSVDILATDKIDGHTQVENSESAILKFDKQSGKYKVWMRNSNDSGIWVENTSDKIPNVLEEYNKIDIESGQIVDKNIKDTGSIYVLSGKINPEIELNGSLEGCKIESTSLADISIYLDKVTLNPVRLEIHGKNIPVSSNSTSYSVEIEEYSKVLRYDSFEQIELYAPGELEESKKDKAEYNPDGTENLSKSLVGLKLKDAELNEFILVPADYDNRLEANSSSTTYLYKVQNDVKEAYSVIIENTTNDFAYAINCKIVDASYAEPLTNESKLIEKFQHQ